MSNLVKPIIGASVLFCAAAYPIPIFACDACLTASKACLQASHGHEMRHCRLEPSQATPGLERLTFSKLNCSDSLGARPENLEAAAPGTLAMPYPQPETLAMTHPQTDVNQKQPTKLSAKKIVSAFERQGFRINTAEAGSIAANVQLAVNEARAHGIGNSKVDFAAVEIAQDLSVGTDNATIRRIVAALGELSGLPKTMRRPSPEPLPIRRKPYPLPQPQPIQPPRRPIKPLPDHTIHAPALSSNETSWEKYFDETVNLWNQPGFMNLMRQYSFSPVKISWEDIGRYQGSVWGDRISDVGIWTRRYEKDPSSARLAVSVRRDSNFRDKVLMVPSEKIKVHVREKNRVIEKTLPQRLLELGLSSPTRDKNVIVSNQFAIVPVPAHSMNSMINDAPGSGREKTAPRVTFNFSIFPYGSTNFVITDVIEGSSEAVVGPGVHQLLYANIDGQKAPFTASRADERQDLLALERELKSKGMDVDVQRYYLIQIPLRKDATNITLSNMGTPPRERSAQSPIVKLKPGEVTLHSDIEKMKYDKSIFMEPQPPTRKRTDSVTVPEDRKSADTERAGLIKVAIGHGETEGPYSTGSGYQGQRADEPIRVTVIYFVTPVGKISETDMQTFARVFSQWEEQAIWGGSFVVKE